PDGHAVPLDGEAFAQVTGRRAVVRAVDFDAAVEVHGAPAVLVAAKRGERQRLRSDCSSANIAATWRFVVPWMRVSAQRVSQASKYAWANSRVSKRIPCSGVRWVWPMPDSTFPFRSGWRTRQGR